MSVTKKEINITKENFGELLLASTNEALEHAKEKISLNTTRLELPDEPPLYSKSHVKKIREKILKVSQPVFANILACSSSTVKSWERGENKPNGPARRLLQLIEKNPSLFLESIS